MVFQPFAQFFEVVRMAEKDLVVLINCPLSPSCPLYRLSRRVSCLLIGLVSCYSRGG